MPWTETCPMDQRVAFIADCAGPAAPGAPLCRVTPTLPSHVTEPQYDATHQVRRVKEKGQIKWRGDRVFISEAVRGECVGLAETERGDWTVRFMRVELGRIDRHTRRFTPAWHGRRIG